MGLGEHVIEDYATLRLSLKAHPLALLRDWLAAKRAITARQLWHTDPGRRVTVCGLVLVRQRPGSAKGVIFATLEDETGFANLIVWPNLLRALPRHRHDRPPARRHRHAAARGPGDPRRRRAPHRRHQGAAPPARPRGRPESCSTAPCRPPTRSSAAPATCATRCRTGETSDDCRVRSRRLAPALIAALSNVGRPRRQALFNGARTTWNCAIFGTSSPLPKRAA